MKNYRISSSLVCVCVTIINYFIINIYRTISAKVKLKSDMDEGGRAVAQKKLTRNKSIDVSTK